MHPVVLPPVLTLSGVSLIYGIHAVGPRRPPWRCEGPAFGSGTPPEAACVWSRELDWGVLWEDPGSAPSPRPAPWRRGGDQGREPPGELLATASHAFTSARRAARAALAGAALSRAAPSSLGRLAASLPFLLICDICSELVPPVIRTPRSCADLRLRAGARGALSIRPF